MNNKPFLDLPVIDGHIHFSLPVLTASLAKLVVDLNLKKINLVSIPDADFGNHNPALIHYKLANPQQTYICGALDYLSGLAKPEQAPQAFAGQIQRLKAAGFDGLKLLESKPMVRKLLKIPLDGPVYDLMWAQVEELGLPVVWHVADPQEFWDPQRCPDWARTNGWYYGDGTYPSLDTLYSEVEHILTRHPRLKVILAHFFFLSEHFDQAADFLDAHPNACFDLTPGSEMFFNFSKHPQRSRDFFIQYSQRLIYGSDIGASAILKIPEDGIPREESLGRAWVVRKFLESSGTFKLPTGVTHWARGGENLEGIALPPEELTAIYTLNFTRFFGKTPTAVNLVECRDLLERLASVIDARRGHPVDSPARQVSLELSSQ